jgi:hypothetical protein
MVDLMAAPYALATAATDLEGIGSAFSAATSWEPGDDLD